MRKHAFPMRDLTQDILAKLNIGAPKFSKKDVGIFFQGDTASSVGVSTFGKVLAQTYTQDGQSIWLEEFGPGDVIAIESVLSGKALPFELVAKTDVKIIHVPKHIFLNALTDNPKYLEIVLAEVSTRLIHNTERLIEAHTLSARGRICAELIRHSKPIGVDPGKHIIRPVPIFSKFALRVGSTRESVSRTVSSLVKKGILTRQAGALIIADMEKLEVCIK